MNSYIKYSIAEEKQNILNYLKERKIKLNEDGIVELGLFGSFARDEADLASDVDICIKSTDIFCKKYLGFEAVIYLDKLREEFVRKFKRRVDICDIASFSEEKKQSLLRGVIYV
ncbi:nucleotidyltransferase family protein [Campylobacter upsaliensis]|uniref:nucleotidyltransferase family protein n=1 Tax=Campylobacter upsaliensis TaxID=28080 RepID=UPI00127FA3DA|nr:nucleotidyltransferase domain-containing protein [Campylobacter upsaliensis]EAI4101023.1 nucleotidyltransferase domain-containing protein [Campylobacter jejuni]EAH4720870.1 nucleotidyltransferase domain-containing protein [Campylobacter upsaliensis]EAH5886942.1 nucleotidyltransferase domain-containing protein [Campylobacter upsaliensis]EAI4357707.1 nucleotidyltransferase domain-containing protein [Campylobacter upsaliensis]EAI5602679.1 nucleotidyltransferase domain-containing protein [Campy